MQLGSIPVSMNHCIKLLPLNLFLILSLLSCTQKKDSYTVWKEQSKTNIRLLPEYGHAAKTKQQLETDSAFIKTATQKESPEKASEALVQLGFKYLNNGDPQTAMYRFNQAWLLNPKNPEIYWGFGSVYFSFKDYRNAVMQYNEGLSLDPKNKGILKDKALAAQLLRKKN